MKPMATCRHKSAIGSVLAANNSMSTGPFGRHLALSRRRPTPRHSVAQCASPVAQPSLAAALHNRNLAAVLQSLVEE
jgi:hypothetical protein